MPDMLKSIPKEQHVRIILGGGTASSLEFNDRDFAYMVAKENRSMPMMSDFNRFRLYRYFINIFIFKIIFNFFLINNSKFEK